MKNFNYLLMLYCIALFSLLSCSKEKQPEKARTLPVDTYIRDLNNGTTTIGQPDAISKPIYFSLLLKKPVASHEDWDISFGQKANTAIMANTKNGTWLHTANIDYDKVSSRPSLTYKETQSANGSTSASGWYHYDANEHIVTPLPAKTIFIKKGNGQVYKLAMISIYKGAPKYPTTASQSTFLSFKYAELVD